MAPKPVALGAAACLMIGWLAASLLSPPVAQLQTRQAARAARSDVTPPPVAFTETLRLKLQRNDAAPTLRRNPFVFGARTPAPSAAIPKADVDQPADPPPAPAIVAPPYSLSGIGSTATPDGGEVRTAVLSDGRTVYLVKAGETFNGYTVAAVELDAVTLVDASGARFSIRMR